MQNYRVLLAIGLSFVIFLAWGFFFSEEEPQQASKKQAQQSAGKTDVAKTGDSVKKLQAGQGRPLSGTVSETAPQPAQVAPEPVPDARVPKTVTVNTSLFSVKISEKGAAFESFVLKDYKETVEEDSPLKELISQGKGISTIVTGFDKGSLPGLENAFFSCDSAGDVLNFASEPGTVSFSRESDGITVKKIYDFTPDSYVMNMKVVVENRSARTIVDSIRVSLVQALPEKKEQMGFGGPSAFINKEVVQVETDDIPEESVKSGKVQWTAIQDRYFLSSVISENPVDGDMKLALNADIFENRFVRHVSAMEPGNSYEFNYKLYFGPRSVQVLNTTGYNLDKAVDFGWFDVLAKPCLFLLNLFYGFIPNYGIAIILLTLVTKIVFWPLGTKSYKSMNEMKRIQPLVTELREKYKHDKKKMNEEMMRMYKTYKINPMGGCLPMLIQFPVFIALYRMLYEAIELRHAPFMLWINDLSAPERLFSFGFSIPFMEPPYGIPLLTIFMGASMFFQQKMSPPPGDPSQAKIMQFLPVVFAVIFINFSSGLVLYWLVSNLLSMGQQYYIGKKHS